MSANLDLKCCKCGNPAAHFSLLKASEGESREHQRNQDRLERSGFMGKSTTYENWGWMSAIFEALTNKDYNAARHLDIDLVAFICRECNEPYCENCWTLGPEQFDDGFYDCTEGTCPAGHTQIVHD